MMVSPHSLDDSRDSSSHTDPVLIVDVRRLRNETTCSLGTFTTSIGSTGDARQYRTLQDASVDNTPLFLSLFFMSLKLSRSEWKLVDGHKSCPVRNLLQGDNNIPGCKIPVGTGS